MLPLLATAAQSVVHTARVLSHFGALSGATAMEMHPLVFALFSAFSGVLLASATVFTRKAVARAPRASRSVPGALPVLPIIDACGNSLYFSLGPHTNSTAKKTDQDVASERRAAVNRKAQKRAEAELLAESYSQFSLVDMTFETTCRTGPQKVPEHAKFRESTKLSENFIVSERAKSASEKSRTSCVIDIAHYSSPDSNTSLPMSTISPPTTPLPRTPRARSPTASTCKSVGSEGSRFDWIPPQSPILVIGGEYGYRKPAKISAPGDPLKKKIDDDTLNDKSSSLVTAHSLGSKCAIVRKVGLNEQSKSKALGSQLVEMSLLDDLEEKQDSSSRRQWSFFAPWRALSVETDCSTR